jgi:hypothetical protein
VEAPTAFTPGDTIDLFVKVLQTGQQRWGFELTVLDDMDQPVGDLIVTEPARTQLSIGGRQYLKHTLSGTDPGTFDESPGWTLKWASPASRPGPVTFYIAGNAANGNGLRTGDFIYTNVLLYDENQTGVEPVIDPQASWGKIKALFL